MTSRRFTVTPPPLRLEHRHTFACFGGECTVIVADAARPADAAAAAAMARDALHGWHHRFSRFELDSELNAFNNDLREHVPATPLLRRAVQTALRAARDSGGLVDFTLAGEIEHAGYAESMRGHGIPLADALRRAPVRGAASPRADARWRGVSVDHREGTITRPPGLRIDLGGIVKGVFADVLAEMLEDFDAYAIDCAGDLRLGGRVRLARPVAITGPFDGAELYRFGLRSGAVATSGIGRRSWNSDDDEPGHHLLDPRTGRPAFTGLVQATALAPTAAEAEMLAKAALLSGPARAAEWLTFGGLVVAEDGSYELLEPAPPASRPSNQAATSSSTASRSGSLKISW